MGALKITNRFCPVHPLHKLISKKGGVWVRKRSIFYNALLLTGVNLLLRGVSMVFQVYLSRRIGAAGVGLLQLVLTVETAAITFGLSGARVAAMYLCAEEYGRRRLDGVRSALTHCLCFGAVCSVLTGAALLFGSEWIADTWLHEPLASGCLRITALALPLRCCAAILSAYFTACGQVRRLVRVDVIERLACLALTMFLLLAFAGDSPTETCSAVLLGSIFTEAAACAALGVMICRDLRGHAPRAGLHMGQRMAKLCLPLAASDYLRSGLRTIEQFLIPWGLMRAGGSYEAAMAEYGMFGGMVFPVLMFPAAFLYALSDLLVPELARSRAEGNRVRVRHLTQKCLRMGLLFAGAVAGGLFALAPWLGQAIYGLDTPGRLLRILSPMVLSLYMDAIVDGMLKGLGEQVSCVRYNTITIAMDVLLLRALLPRFGLAAYLLSFAVTHLVNFALSLRRLLAVTGHAPDIRYAVRALLCTAGAAAAAFSVFGPGLWPILLGRTALFAVSFAGLLRLTGTLERSDTVWLRQALRGH